MPVLVTAAHQPLARRVALRLVEEGGEVRAAADGDVTSLRAAGVFVATATVDDEGRLEAALEQVHTVVHIGGGLATPEPGRIVVAAQALARAATNAGVRRIIALSLPGARRDAEDPIRRAKARAEELIAEVPCPTVVVRCNLVDSPLLRDALVTCGLPDEVLQTPVAPVRADDLAELIVAFDRARSSSPDGHLLVHAHGARRGSVGSYLDTVDPGGRTASRLGRRLPDPAVADRLEQIVRGPWFDEDPAIVDGWGFAGLVPRAPGLC